MSWRWALARRVAALAATGGGGGAQAQRLLPTSSAAAGTGLLGRHHMPLASQIRSKVHSSVPLPSLPSAAGAAGAGWLAARPPATARDVFAFLPRPGRNRAGSHSREFACLIRCLVPLITRNIDRSFICGHTVCGMGKVWLFRCAG
jgi:hypothetical protein